MGKRNQNRDESEAEVVTEDVVTTTALMDHATLIQTIAMQLFVKIVDPVITQEPARSDTAVAAIGAAEAFADQWALLYPDGVKAEQEAESEPLDFDPSGD